MILNLSNFEQGMCAGGDSCHCVCWKATSNDSDHEVAVGNVNSITLNLGVLSGAVPGSALQMCRVQCNLREMKLRRCT